MRRLLLLLLFACGCGSFTYSRVNFNQPRSDAQIESLNEGDDLGRCLDVLGAPDRVWPTGHGMAMVYTWRHEVGWGVRASTAINSLPISFTYSQDKNKLHGVVLHFDDGYKLDYIERGFVSKLTGIPNKRQAEGLAAIALEDS